ncbi:MAG: hypothetical protein UU46_C0004G0038, partial [Candidatus Uhrbacteria bacterium GW2011_GWD1_41_16]
DSDPGINPGVEEICDSVDNDCDGLIDEDDAIDALVWYQDADADSYGDLTVYAYACTVPSGYTADSSDCDDTRADFNPGATDEVVTAWDEDCDGRDGRDGQTFVSSLYGTWTAYGDNLILEVDRDQLSTFESGSSLWENSDGLSAPVSTHIFSSIYSGALEVLEFPENTGVVIMDGWIAGAVVSGLTVGQDYGFVAVAANTSVTGYTAIKFLDQDDMDGYLTVGSSDLFGYHTLFAGSEAFIGEVFEATDTEATIYICARGSSGADEQDLRFTHFGVYELVP